MAVSPPIPTSPASSVGRSTAVIESTLTKAHTTGSRYLDYQSAADLRVLSELVKQQPASGGVHFARLALAECFGFRLQLDRYGDFTNGPISGPRSTETDNLKFKRVEALARLEKRCATYSVAETSEQGFRNLRDVSGGKDALYALYETARGVTISSSTFETRLEIVERLLNANDESLFPFIKGMLVDQSRLPPHDYVNHFEGRPESGLPNPVSYGAWQIAQCTYFQSCDRFDSRTDAICARGGGCGETFRETVLTSLPLTQPQRAAVVATGERIAAALRARNFAAFARPAA